MPYKLHAYGSLHAGLPPPDIQQETPQPASPSSINAGEHYCNTPGNDGEGNTADKCIVTGHQQAAVCPQTAHVEGSLCMCSCLFDGPRDTEDCCLHCCDIYIWYHSYKRIACGEANFSSGVFIATTASLVALWVTTMTIFGIVTAVLCWRNHKLKHIGKTIIQCY